LILLSRGGKAGKVGFDFKDTLDDESGILPGAVQIVAGVGVESLVCSAVTEILENMQKLAELEKFAFAHRIDGELVAKTVFAALAAKTEEEEGESFESVQSKALAWMKLTDGAEHLAKLELREERDRIHDGQRFDVGFELIHILRNRARITDDVEFALEGPRA
jgi:hypothetical protein